MSNWAQTLLCLAPCTWITAIHCTWGCLGRLTGNCRWYKLQCPIFLVGQRYGCRVVLKTKYGFPEVCSCHSISWFQLIYVVYFQTSLSSQNQYALHTHAEINYKWFPTLMKKVVDRGCCFFIFSLFYSKISFWNINWHTNGILEIS